MDGQRQEIYRKYANMQKLCMSIDSSNDWIISLQEAPMKLFLTNIKIKIQSNPSYSIEDFYLNILTISKIDDASINPDDKTKVKRYIEYFLKITKAII